MKNPKIRPKRHVVERLLKRSRYRWNYCYMRWGHARSDQLLVACERTAGNRASPVIRSVRTWLAERGPREKVTALIDQGRNGPEGFSLPAIYTNVHRVRTLTRRGIN